MQREGHLWVVVLAAGDGTRVATLTAGPRGESVPKQYFTFGERESMLQWALARASALVPASRILVIVADQHRSHWERQLADLPRQNVIVQPQNRGTAAGVLLPFLEVFLRRDPEAHFLLLPADHFVARESVLGDAMRTAVRASRRPGGPLVLLGMSPEEPDPEYGWILPSAAASVRLRSVARFVEKPDRGTAADLSARGGLINSFVMAASSGAILRLFETTIPGLLRMFLGVCRRRDRATRIPQLYERIPTVDFSRDVLTHATASLAVLAVPACGWSDLGTPARVERHLLLRRGEPRPAGSIGPRRPSAPRQVVA
jgi:mannose-1-phosphate guanylyltransferase